MQETEEMWVRSLGQEDPLERARQSTPVFLPGKSHGQKTLALAHSVAKSQTWLKQLAHIGHEGMGLDAMISVFWMLSFKQAFSLSSFTLIKRLFSSSSLSAIRVVFYLQFSSVAQSCLDSVIPWTAARQASLSITNSWSLLKLMSIASVIPSNHLILCRPLLLPSSIFPSIGVFSNESVLRIRWPKYWSLSFSISPSNKYSGLISFRMDWLDLLAVQGTLKSLL